jgi:glycosyltransferase involved in cell wall biosynthesis
MACVRLSGWLPQRIVCPSEASRRWHIGFGYPEYKFTLIPNGIDIDEFHPDKEARASVRAELGLSSDTALVGLVARFDPQKDHSIFVKAAARVLASRPATDFLLCGGGIHWGNRTLRTWIEAAGLRNRFHLLGEREDMPRLTAALDIAALSSTSEAGPMVVLEAMACGVPCACTDVGDIANMIGDTGRIVPAENPEALGDAIVCLLSAGEEQRARMGSAARNRLREKYLLSDVAQRYDALYADLVYRS